jgi:hypothetical protein
MNRKCGVPAPPEAPIRTKWSAHSTGHRSAPDFDPCRPEIACSTAEMKSTDCYTSTPKGTMRIGQPRNLADYAISAALSYPESVTYRQSNDTFAIERAIYPVNAQGDITGPSTWKVHVVISASDGKIITAYPMSTK